MYLREQKKHLKEILVTFKKNVGLFTDFMAFTDFMGIYISINVYTTSKCISWRKSKGKTVNNRGESRERNL
jgi:hypothetical protein